MPDFADRFRALDRVSAPSSWPDLDRYEHPAGAGALRRGDLDPAWRKPVGVLVAFAVAIAGIAVWWLAYRSTPPGPAGPSPEGRLALVSTADNDADIFVVNADGTDLHPITSKQFADVESPSWSPDGRSIAFSGNVEGVGDPAIYVVDTDGSNVRRLTPDEGQGEAPSWSPDGARIAFIAPREWQESVYVMNADGSDLRAVSGFTITAWGDYRPTWSPDGSRIAYSAGYLEHVPGRIFVVPVEGGEDRRLTDAPNDARTAELAPVWLSDGDLLYLSGTSIRRVAADGSNDHVVLDTTQVSVGKPVSLTASPDGSMMAFTSGGRVYTARVDGTNVHAPLAEANPGERLISFSSVAWGPIAEPTRGPSTGHDGSVTAVSHENGDGTARCSAEVPGVVEPGRPTGVRAWIENLSDEPITHNVGGSVASVVVYGAEGRLLWDSLSALGPDRAVIAIGDTPLEPGGRKELAVIDVPVRWSGPLTVVVACSLQSNGSFELASVDVEVAVPGPTPDREFALARAFEGTGALFDECGTDGTARVGQIAPPGGAADVPPMQVRCAAEVELHAGFAVVTIHFESPPDAPADFRVPRYLHEIAFPDGVDPVLAGRWMFVVTDEDVFEAIGLQTAYWSPSGAALAIYSFDEDEGWYRGEGACDTQPGEYRAGIVFLIPC